MITFATFYIDSAKSAQETIAKENILLENRNQYFQMIDMLFRSAAIYHPDCKKVILTDKNTDLGQLASDVIVHRVEMNPDAVMLGRLIAQLDYTQNEDARSDIVFLDSDMLINSSLEPLFEEDFQVALTYRIHDEMPINGGVIFVSKAQKPQATEFLTDVLKIYREKYAAHSAWWGDQYALHDAVGADLRAQVSDSEPLQCLNANGLKTLLVPCSIYNFSPEIEFGEISSRLAQPAIIHFKGYRKKLIPYYWNAYLAPHERSGPGGAIASLKGKSALQFRVLEERARRHLPYLFSTARNIRSAVRATVSLGRSQQKKTS